MTIEALGPPGGLQPAGSETTSAPAMTAEEARAFIAEAEALPPGEVDTARLAEAIRALNAELAETGKGRTDPEADWLNRGMALAATTGLLPSAGFPDEPAVDEGGEVAPLTLGEALSRLDAGFRDRLSSAAAAVDIPDAQLVSFIANALSFAAQDETGQNPAELLLENLVIQWEAQAKALRGRPIGVPDNFVAQRFGQPGPGAQFGRFAEPGLDATTPPPQAVEPRYFAGDEYSPAGLDPAQIARTQSRLVAAGLIEEGNYWAGFWDTATADAYATALGFANQSGVLINTAIDRLIATLPESLKEQRARAEAAKTFTAPPFFAPDTDTLAQEVKAMFRRQVGRDPKPSELAEMTSALGADFRAAYDERVTAERAAFDADQASLAAGEVPETAGPFTDIDPAARFAELFESRYKPEVDRLVGLDETRFNTANVFASLRTMTSMIGGR